MCTIYAVDGSNNVASAQLTIRGVSVNVSPSTVVLHVGDTQEFEATGGTKEYIWTSSDNSVGTVEPTGGLVTFTAISEGTTTLTVTDNDNYTGSATVTVVAAAGSAVIVLPNSVSVEKAQTYQFSASGGTDTYSWGISDPNVGSIDPGGLFTAAKKVGSATVTATDTDGNVGTATVAVVDSPITISPDSITVTVGTQMTFVGTGGTGAYWW